MPDDGAELSAPSHFGFRLTTLLFAVLLGAYCVWLALPEFFRPDIDRLPPGPTAAASAAKQRDAALEAASFGVIRGELWSASAFTYAFLLDDQRQSGADLASSLAGARTSLNRALKNAPTQSGAWLLLAGLALRYPSAYAPLDAAEVLKMSYYTGPSDDGLVPIRLDMAVQTNDFNDVEMSQFIDRDLRLLLQRKQIAAIVTAYNAASADGKRFVEQTVGDIDPTALNMLRIGGKR
jgi:hypothetical protein